MSLGHSVELWLIYSNLGYPARITRQRGLHGYSQAEQALAETVQYSLEHCSSTRDLQINVLKQATSLLNAHIIDAKERV